MPGFEVFGEEERREAMEVFDTGVLFRYEFGEQRRGVYKVREFEEKFARYCGVSHAQAVTSGTAALKVALVALGVANPAILGKFFLKLSNLIDAATLLAKLIAEKNSRIKDLHGLLSFFLTEHFKTRHNE